MQFKSQLVEGNIVEILAYYSFSRIETLKSETFFTYLNLMLDGVTVQQTKFCTTVESTLSLYFFSICQHEGR